MSLFFRMLRHLLPTGRAWRLTIEKNLRRFFQGLSGFGSDVHLFIDRVWEDIFPQTSRELAAWEKQHGLAGTGTEDERIAALVAEWLALGGQSLEYIQNLVRSAGFPVTLHEHWVSGRTAYDLDQAYIARGANLAGVVTDIRGFDTGNRGQFFFVVANLLGSLLVFRLSFATAYDVGSSVTLDQAISVAGQAANPQAIKVSRDGRIFYVLDRATARVLDFSSPTPWSFAGLSYSGNFLDVNAQEPNPTGMALSYDGAHLYVVGLQGIVFQYDLTTPGQLNSGSYSGKSFPHPQVGPGFVLRGIALSKDGSRCALLDGNSVATQFEFGNRWQADTLSPVGTPFSMSAQAAAMSDIVFGGNGGQAPGYDNGTKLLTSDIGSTLYQYSVADYDVRNPHDYLTIPRLGRATCGGANNTCQGDYPEGAPNVDVVCSTEQTSASDYLVNKDLTNRAPPPIPQDPDTWPYFFYVGAETFGDTVPIPAGRRAEFERLLLKLRPAQQWIGLFIDYQEGFILVDDDGFVLTDDNDFILTN